MERWRSWVLHKCNGTQMDHARHCRWDGRTWVAERMIKASKCLIFSHRASGDRPYASSTCPCPLRMSMPARRPHRCLCLRRKRCIAALGARSPALPSFSVTRIECPASTAAANRWLLACQCLGRQHILVPCQLRTCSWRRSLTPASCVQRSWPTTEVHLRLQQNGCQWASLPVTRLSCAAHTAHLRCSMRLQMLWRSCKHSSGQHCSWASCSCWQHTAAVLRQL